MTKKGYYIILGIALGVLTKIGIEKFFPQMTGVPYVICTLLSLLLIVAILMLVFRLSDKLK